MTLSKPWMGIVLGCWLSLPIPPAAHADKHNKNQSEDEIPDRELLEFIAEFGDTDNETFELMIYHGQHDLEQTDEPAKTQEPDHEH